MCNRSSYCILRISRSCRNTAGSCRYLPWGLKGAFLLDAMWSRAVPRESQCPPLYHRDGIRQEWSSEKYRPRGTGLCPIIPGDEVRGAKFKAPSWQVVVHVYFKKSGIDSLPVTSSKVSRSRTAACRRPLTITSAARAREL